MNLPLNIEISCFANYRTPDNPQPVNMLAWLKSDTHKNKVEQIRTIETKEQRDKIKAQLPAITPSGLFERRAESALIQHSGLLQFDIDAKQNTKIGNYQSLKQQIANIQNVAYLGLSVSGTGFWGLVPIKYPKKHKQHFLALKKAFKDVGITIDGAPKNVASLRGYSYDPDGYFNHRAKVFTNVYTKPQPRPQRTKYHSSGEDTRSKVETLIGNINTDITAGYQNWLKLGFALEDEFGKSGREYFHAISSYHPDYNRRKCDRQYTHCLNHNGQGVTIGTFFHVCKRHGFTLERQNSRSVAPKQKDNGSTGKYERGYPPAWDKIQLEPDSEQYLRATMIALQDATPTERDYLTANF